MEEQDYLVGFDLGGTKMIASLLDRSGSVLASSRGRTPGESGADPVTEAMADLVRELCADAKVPLSALRAVGAAVPGILDEDADLVTLTNLNLKNYPLRAKLQKALGVPVILENDVNAGTWAEFVAGAGKGKKNLVGVFVGTGIGGAIVLDGKLHRGSRGAAGEVGHMIVLEGGPLCGCGRYGCLEALASRTAMAKDAVAAIAAGLVPELVEKTGTDFKKLKSSAFEKALAKGNPVIAKIVERSAYHLGVGLSNLAMALDPDCFVLGGGFVARLGDHYVKAVENSLKALMPGGPEILIGALGDDAVPLGAAFLARERLAGPSGKNGS